jgi:hypothetical protein
MGLCLRVCELFFFSYAGFEGGTLRVTYVMQQKGNSASCGVIINLGLGAMSVSLTFTFLPSTWLYNAMASMGHS